MSKYYSSSVYYLSSSSNLIAAAAAHIKHRTQNLCYRALLIFLNIVHLNLNVLVAY
jgi:hypothetical protein